MYNGIIIFGQMGSGKDTMKELLKKHDSRVEFYKIGDLVRSFNVIFEINPYYKEHSRDLYQGVSDNLRNLYPDILNEFLFGTMVKKWKNKYGWEIPEEKSQEALDEHLLARMRGISSVEIPVIADGRLDFDVSFWRKRDFLVVGMFASIDTCYERLVERDGEDVARNSNFNHPMEINARRIVQEDCDFVVNNTFNDIKRLEGFAQQVIETYFK